jgi:signal transduction histidine kinase
MNKSQIIRASWGAWMSQSYQPVGPRWLQYIWTFLFSMVVAAIFTVVGLAMFGGDDSTSHTLSGVLQWYFSYLVVSLAIGFCIHGLFDAARSMVGVARIRQFTGWQRAVYFSAIPIGGTLIGMVVGLALLGNDVRDGAPRDLVFGLLVWFAFSLYFSTRHKRIVAEHRAAQAQLRLLQGQMEPHFLFNTLANVVSLIDIDAPRAKLMLESFTDYLRASLGSLRHEEQGLGDELGLIEAYLRVVKVRMDDRLDYSFEVPAALRPLRLPALSLQPLVENAVVHGLEPKIDGGRVRIAATLDAAGSLVVTVTDDGLGLEAASAAGSRGSGTALANIRERLRQTDGSLTIEPATPQGVRATLTVPVARKDRP